jgi:hypothetical protein
MAAFELLAERKILEAVSRGELDDLPGAGKPLALDDDALIPEERLVLEGEMDAEAHSRAVRKLALLKTRLDSRYYENALKKLGR